LGLYPSRGNPYYVVSHPYTRVSAGIRSLHLLCHSLNLSGFPAYMVFIGEESLTASESATEPDLLTPILTQRVARKHFQSGLTPIMVYPEIISGNPFDSPCVVRYVLNFPGLLGGDASFPEGEMCFGYSKTLAETTGYPENVLFIPASDTRVFYPPEKEYARQGSCFYATKYQREHKGKLFDITSNSIEITSRLPTSQTPEEIAEIFRKSEVFYTYENTALAIEATLCGCPAVFLPNPHLKSIIASNELGQDGIAWGSEPAEVERAKATVGNAVKNYEKSLDNFQKHLDDFIGKTQVYSTKRTYSHSQYLQLYSNLAPSQKFDEIASEIGAKERQYAPLLRKLPFWLERQIGAFLCSFGLLNDGEFLWNRAVRRRQIQLGKKPTYPD
jgi:hypothetical protein